MLNGMQNFDDELRSFLRESGVCFESSGNNLLLIPATGLLIVEVPLCMSNSGYDSFSHTASNGFSVNLSDSKDTLYLFEDMWRSGGDSFRKRILARCGIFDSLFARKCRVVQLVSQKEKEMARAFLNDNHSYGWCSSKYCYALELPGGRVVAVATFSGSLLVERKRGLDLFLEQGSGADAVLFDSYQWLRYASIAGVRVVGGMGRLLKRFIEDAKRNLAKERGIEIMSYSDNEWSNGSVYQRLGFNECGGRKPVEFIVEQGSFKRVHLSRIHSNDALGSSLGGIPITNLGSRRFLLQLT